MNKTIWKQRLELGPNTLQLPAGAEVLYVAEQGGSPNIWFLFSDKYMNEKEKREFEVWGTGHPIPMREQYLGSCQCGVFVWHVFERRQ